MHFEIRLHWNFNVPFVFIYTYSCISFELLMHYLGWDSKLLQFIVLYKTWCMSTPLLNERIKRERWLNGTVKCFRLICSEHVRWFWNCSILPIRHFGYMLSLWQTNHYVFYVMSYWVNPFSYIVNIINYMQIEAGYFQLLASFRIKLLFYITYLFEVVFIHFCQICF